MTKRLRVGVVFGGRSGEHEVSLRSARSIIGALDPAKYEIIEILITKDGQWLAEGWKIALLGDPTVKGLQNLDGAPGEGQTLDVIFPVLHGTYGEDGTIQGLFEMADVPYVGCGVLASATGMDKVVMKRLFREAGLPIVEFTHVLRTEWEARSAEVEARIAAEIGYPCFVKPANLGSSVGISKAKDAESLKAAIALAARFDRKIVIERGVEAREIELSVLGNDAPQASVPGEIVPETAEFYDYRAKYVDDTGARLVITADLSAEVTRELQELAVRAFQAIDGAGLGRVDFFIERSSQQIFVNEINTMPGFTSISMYPKLWEASGVGYAELLDRLIELAIERHGEKSRNVTSYD